MQAVILAAGRGTRMGALTEGTPKSMLEVGGKTLLEHKFDALPDAVDEIIIIVGYLGGIIHDRYGGDYNGKRILYEEQENIIGGTADALWQAKDVLHNRFLVLMGDDLYSEHDMERVMAPDDGWTQLVEETNRPRAGGNVVFDKNHHITSIEEGMHAGQGYIGTNCYQLDTRIFDFTMVPKATGSKEMGLPQTALAAAKKLKIPFYAVKASAWIQITAPEDLEFAEKVLAHA